MQPEVMVLMSGGVDSSALVSFYTELGRPTCGLFINYGQAAAFNEARSATAIARHYSIPLGKLRVRGASQKASGLIQGRNLFLLSSAIMERARTVRVVAIGIHTGTEYVDCSGSFFRIMQDVVALLDPHNVHLAAPFLEWSKVEIYSYCRDAGVPIELTYSCERGGIRPCGRCLSCKDRRLLRARSPIRA